MQKRGFYRRTDADGGHKKAQGQGALLSSPLLSLGLLPNSHSAWLSGRPARSARILALSLRLSPARAAPTPPPPLLFTLLLLDFPSTTTRRAASPMPPCALAAGGSARRRLPPRR
uniref:Uncharacterized protein n=1 Tax=Oryza glumipatula TaxID=40148 RepID=A0A0D9YB40_9ORYZ